MDPQTRKILRRDPDGSRRSRKCRSAPWNRGRSAPAVPRRPPAPGSRRRTRPAHDDRSASRSDLCHDYASPILGCPEPGSTPTSPAHCRHPPWLGTISEGIVCVGTVRTLSLGSSGLLAAVAGLICGGAALGLRIHSRKCPLFPVIPRKILYANGTTSSLRSTLDGDLSLELLSLSRRQSATTAMCPSEQVVTADVWWWGAWSVLPQANRSGKRSDLMVTSRSKEVNRPDSNRDSGLSRVGWSRVAWFQVTDGGV